MKIDFYASEDTFGIKLFVNENDYLGQCGTTLRNFIVCVLN